MAIKIKNRKGEEPPEEEQGAEGGAVVPPGKMRGNSLDGFERVTFMATAWLENNRKLFFGIVGVVAIAVIGIVLGVAHVRGQQVEASDRLSVGLAAYEMPVDGVWNPMERVRMLTEFPELEDDQKHPDEETKWRIVYDSAANTLEDFDGGPIADSARMTKAAAAANLGNPDESVQLYRKVIGSEDLPQELKAMAHVGLANSLASTGEVDEAIELWDVVAEMMPDRKAYADLERARMVERHAMRQGDEDLKEQARELYRQFSEDHPDSDHLNEVERRKALL